MQDEALSPAGRSPWFRYWPVVLLLVLVGLYFGVSSGIRAYVSSRIDSVVGRTVPAFALQDRSGKPWTAADLRGRVTVLNFFRSRCVGCVRERQAVRTLAGEAAARGILVLSVMMDEVEGYPAEVTTATLASFAYRHPVLMANAEFVEAFHGVGWSHVTPITYVVDAKGVVTKSLRGHQSLETLRAATK